MANWLARAASAIPALRESPAPLRARQWRICYPNGKAMTVLFAPAAARTEVADVYRGATMEPTTDGEARTATAADVDELRPLVATILADASDAERSEALATALADPVAALACFRILVGSNQ